MPTNLATFSPLLDSVVDDLPGRVGQVRGHDVGVARLPRRGAGTLTRLRLCPRPMISDRGRRPSAGLPADGSRSRERVEASGRLCAEGGGVAEVDDRVNADAGRIGTESIRASLTPLAVRVRLALVLRLRP